MQRVAVVGGPGSGKSTVAKVLASRLDAPLTELDALWWQPSWTPADLEDFRSQVEMAVAGDAWVIEGTYLAEVGCDFVWPRADTLVWLDPARRSAINRVLRRTVVRVLTREQLWGTNRQGISSLTPWSVAHLIKRWPRYSRQIETALAQDAYPELDVVRLRNNREVADWLATIP